MPDASSPDLANRQPSAEAPQAPRRWAEWCYRLTPALPLVFLIGTPSLFITRYLYKLQSPDQFVGTSPSISGTASHPPSGDFFKWTMLAVAICIVIAWPLNLIMQWRTTDTYTPLGMRRWPIKAAQVAAAALGVVAAFFLVALSFVSLGQNHDAHILYSILFYVIQVLAIVTETMSCVWLRRRTPILAARPAPASLRRRVPAASVVAAISLLFLYLYVVRDSLPPQVLYPVQLFYVFIEYTVAVLCFAYPFTGFVEIRRYFAALSGRTSPAITAAAYLHSAEDTV